MTVTFTDTHNMIAYLTKSDASEGFNQIIDFLNGSSIKYALTVNPNIYVLCIKQFWTSVAMKKVNAVIRLQALVDKKKVVLTEATIRDALRLDVAEGVECLPNEEIFTELARMSYEKPSTKLTFYKAFFSSQWKFLIHTILQCMSANRTSWNEFSSSMASAVICLSTGRNFNFSKYIFDSLVRNVDSFTKFYMYPCFLQLIIRKQVGDLSLHTTKNDSGTASGEGAAEVNVEDVSIAGVAAEGAASVADDEVPAAVDEPSIPLHTPPTTSPQPSQDQHSTSQVGTAQRIETSDDTVMDDVSKQERIIADIDADKDVTLKDVAAVAKGVQDAEIDKKPAELQEVVKVVTTAKLITEVVTAASAAITAAAPQLTTVAAPILTTAPSAARRRKGVVLRDPKESDTPSIIVYSEAKSKDKGKGILVEEPKPLKKQSQIKQDEAYARELETEAQARKNMMIYLRNVAGFKMDYFKGMTYDDICLIFKKHFDSNVAFLQKTKEQIDEKDSRVLKRLMPNEDDDVYTDATPLALKVPVIDYEIYTKNNKPYYKIKRADARYTSSNLEELKKCSWSSKGQELEAVRVLCFGVYAAEEFKENMLSDYCCQVKLLLLINAAKSN
nr:hypothetical protein [Tanacetum cinerariifolium]